MPNSDKLIEKSQIVLKSLKLSVSKALDRKRRLGQYAVISKSGKIIKLFENKSNKID